MTDETTDQTVDEETESLLCLGIDLGYQGAGYGL